MRTRFFVLAVALGLAVAAQAQTLNDHVLVKKHQLMTGLVYSHDQWDRYYEGLRKRDNGNIGELTTETAALFTDYGISDRLNVIAVVPYVWTEASQGTLHPQDDFQDITVGLKYKVTEKPVQAIGSTAQAFVVLSGGSPLTNYTPDLLPLSIGLQSSWLTGRGIFNVTHAKGWFANASAGYTFRNASKLDRSFYFTNGQAFLTDRMEMPDVLDWMVGAGYQRPRLMIPVWLWRQDTLGGGDIRRQDQPYASNEFDFYKLGASVMWSPQRWPLWALRGEVQTVLSGRNVGDSTAVSAGVFRNFHF